MNDNYFKTNKETWNKKVAVHAKSEMYAMEDFKKGKSSLMKYELNSLPNVTGKSLSLIHSAEARTASCSILEVTKLELDPIPLLNNDLMLQLSASVPPLVNIISFGATSKIDEIISLDSSNIFFAFLDKLCPPEEFANPSCSASIKALIAISRIGVVAAWSR